MAIREVSGTEVLRGSCSIRQIEISEPATPNVYDGSGWEFHCSACDAYSPGLTEQDARDELDSHVCPDVPPCETDVDGEVVLVIRPGVAIRKGGALDKWAGHPVEGFPVLDRDEDRPAHEREQS